MPVLEDRGFTRPWVGVGPAASDPNWSPGASLYLLERIARPIHSAVKGSDSNIPSPMPTLVSTRATPRLTTWSYRQFRLSVPRSRSFASPSPTSTQPSIAIDGCVLVGEGDANEHVTSGTLSLNCLPN